MFYVRFIHCEHEKKPQKPITSPFISAEEESIKKSNDLFHITTVHFMQLMMEREYQKPFFLIFVNPGAIHSRQHRKKNR